MIISAQGNSVSSCLSAARTVAGLKFHESREDIRSGGEDGCYRVTLTDGTVVECLMVLSAAEPQRRS